MQDPEIIALLKDKGCVLKNGVVFIHPPSSTNLIVIKKDLIVGFTVNENNQLDILMKYTEKLRISINQYDGKAVGILTSITTLLLSIIVTPIPITNLLD